MEITKREILFGVVIVAIMMGLGVWLSNPIISKATQKANIIISAVQVKDSAKFDYIRRTDVGDFLAEGDLFAVNPVSIPDIEGVYGKIEKNTEEYTEHTRTVTTTDEKGNTHTETETYWEWDVKKREHWESHLVKFLGREFIPKDIGYRFNTHYHSTIYPPKKKFFSDDIRYVYYVAPATDYGTLRGTVENKTFLKLKFRSGGTIEKAIEKAYNSMNGSEVGFWIFWVLLTGGIVFLFFYAENHWLY